MSEKNLSTAAVPRKLESGAEVNQEIIIHSDGTLEIPWFVPKASDLVLALWDQTTEEPFPVKVNSGQLYCG